MQIRFSSIMVDDQAKALKFYTDALGFVKQADVPLGKYRWLTVSSPEGVAGVELLLEPMGFPPAKAFQKALYDAGIPATVFPTADIDAEYRQLSGRGVRFRSEPKLMGSNKMALFEDTCGNLINLVQTLS